MRSSKYAVVGGSFIFSNSFDGRLSPTLLSKYQSSDKGPTTSKDKEEDVIPPPQPEETPEQPNVNRDIFSFSSSFNSSDLPQTSRSSHLQTVSRPATANSPHISPHKRDIIAFFLTDTGRQETLESEKILEEVPRETIAEPTPDCLTEEAVQVNHDILTFATNERRKMEELGRAPPNTPIAKCPSRTLKKSSLTNEDMISFYSNEESFEMALHSDSLKAATANEEDVSVEAAEEDALEGDEGLDTSADENSENPDQKVFYNYPSPLVTSTPKKVSSISVAGKENQSFVINRDSVVSFYRSEEKYLENFEIASSKMADVKDTAESGVDIVGRAESEEELDISDQRDIKVFSNTKSECFGAVECKEAKDAVRSLSPVLVVTQEFPDIISFYNPDKEEDEEDCADIPGMISVETDYLWVTPVKLTEEIIKLRTPTPHSSQTEDPLKIEDLDYSDVVLETSGGEEQEYVKEEKQGQNESEKEEEEEEEEGLQEKEKEEEPKGKANDEMKDWECDGEEEEEVDREEGDDQGKEEENDDGDDDDDSCSRATTSIVVEDSKSEDGTPIREIKDIDDLPDIEKAIDMVDAIGDMNVHLDLPEPIFADQFQYEEDFEELDTDEDDMASSLHSEPYDLPMGEEKIPSPPPQLNETEIPLLFDELDGDQLLLTKCEIEKIEAEMNNSFGCIEVVATKLKLHDQDQDSASNTALQTSSLTEAEVDSDVEYKTLYEALNKPLLPPISVQGLEREEEVLLGTQSVLSLDPLPAAPSPPCEDESGAQEPEKPSTRELLEEATQTYENEHENNVPALSSQSRCEEMSTNQPKAAIPGTTGRAKRDRKASSMEEVSGGTSILGELKAKFSKGKVASFRSKHRSRRRLPCRWVPVQVIPSPMDMVRHSEVNWVDKDVTIPDIIERREPIARLFNDVSPTPRKSASTSPVRMVSPSPNVFLPIHLPLRYTPNGKRRPSPKIRRRVALYEGLALVDSRRRPVSPGPESRILSCGDLSDPPEEKHPCEGEFHARKIKKWNSQESGLYEGTLKPVGARRRPEMFTPTWQKSSSENPERATSPHWQSFSEAAFGGVQGTYNDHYIPPNIRSPSRARNLSCEGAGEGRTARSAGSQTNTHVDRLARSGSAASLAVVMASTFPNGGDANFDLEGTAAKISEVCKTFGGSQTNLAPPTISEPAASMSRSRSVNSALNIIHTPDAKVSPRPFFMSAERPQKNLRIRTSPEKRVSEPVKAKRPHLTYKETKELQEKLKSAGHVISYRDLITCPRNRLPPHVDKLQLQDHLSDAEFCDVFKMPRSEFDSMANWKRVQLKKDVLLF